MQLPVSPHLLLLLILSATSTSHFLSPKPYQQKPVMPAIPQDSGAQKSNPTLFDTLPLTRRIKIFSGLLRDHPDLPTLLSQATQPSKNVNFTILAPLNSALQALPHKPWESPRDYSELGERAYDGAGGAERAQANLKRFVEAHVVPVSPWREGVRVKTLLSGGQEGGREVWWEERDGEEGEGVDKERVKVVMPDEVIVDGVGSKADNGEVWVLKGVLNP